MSGKNRTSGRTRDSRMETSGLIPDERWYDSGLERIYEDDYSAEISDPYRKNTAKKAVRGQTTLSQSSVHFQDWRKEGRVGESRGSINISPDAQRLKNLFSRPAISQYRSVQNQPAPRSRASDASMWSNKSNFINYRMGFDEFNRLVSNPEFVDPRDELSNDEAYSLYDRPQVRSRGSVISDRGAALRSSSPMIQYIENERRLLTHLKNSKLHDDAERAKSPPKYVLVPMEDYLSGARKQLTPIAPGIFSPNVGSSQILIPSATPSHRHVFESSVSSKQSREQKLMRQLSGTSIAANSISSAKSSLKRNPYQCSECHEVKSSLRLRKHKESSSFHGKPIGAAGQRNIMRSGQLLEDSPALKQKPDRLSVDSA